MSRFDRVLEKVGLVRESQLPTINQNRRTAGHPSEGTWVKVGGGIQWRRDYAQQDMYKDLNEIFRAWRFNPFVHRITENWVNFVVGSGIQFKAKDERVQRIVVDPWLAANEVHERMKKRAREAFLFAELFSAKVINVGSGTVRLGFIDPMNVTKVNFSTLDGDTPISIEVSTGDGTKTLLIAHIDESGTASRIMPEIYGDKRPGGFTTPVTTTGLRVGQVGYLAYNTIIGATRGTSDTLTIIDWCRGLEDLLWSAQTRSKEQAKVIWMMIFKGATPATLTKYRNPLMPDGKTPNKEYVPPPQENGEVAYLNDQMEVRAVTPTMAASDIDQSAKTYRTVISIGSGNPTHLFGEGDGEGYMNAKEKGAPFYQMLESGQRDFLNFWKKEIDFAVDQKRIFTNELVGVTDFRVEVTAPEITAKSQESRANIGKTMIEIISIAKQNQLISQEQAVEAFQAVAADLGWDLEPIQIEPDPEPATDIAPGVQEAFKRIVENR